MYITLQVYAGAHGSIIFRAVFSNRSQHSEYPTQTNTRPGNSSYPTQSRGRGEQMTTTNHHHHHLGTGVQYICIYTLQALNAVQRLAKFQSNFLARTLSLAPASNRWEQVPSCNCQKREKGFSPTYTQVRLRECMRPWLNYPLNTPLKFSWTASSWHQKFPPPSEIWWARTTERTDWKIFSAYNYAQSKS